MKIYDFIWKTFKVSAFESMTLKEIKYTMTQLPTKETDFEDEPSTIVEFLLYNKHIDLDLNHKVKEYLTILIENSGSDTPKINKILFLLKDEVEKLTAQPNMDEVEKLQRESEELKQKLEEVVVKLNDVMKGYQR